MINRFLHSFLLSVRATDIASELLLELSLPLVTFFLAEEVHVSGIIAVVVAGILKASRFKKITLLEAQVDTVTETVWHTVNFMLNGSVFVILGMELEMIAEPILTNPIYNSPTFIAISYSPDLSPLCHSFCHDLWLLCLQDTTPQEKTE